MLLPFQMIPVWISVGRAARNAGEDLTIGAAYTLGHGVGETGARVSNVANTTKYISYGLLAVGGIVLFNFAKKAIS